MFTGHDGVGSDKHNEADADDEESVGGVLRGRLATLAAPQGRVTPSSPRQLLLTLPHQRHIGASLVQGAPKETETHSQITNQHLDQTSNH